VIGGTVFIAGAVLGGINLFKTWQGRPEEYEEPVIEAPALSRVYRNDVPRPESRMAAGSTADFARKLDVFSTLWWHRKWERLPVKFTVLVILAVVVASLFEIIPTFLIRSNVPTISSVKPYAPLELVGRDIYIAEGCYNCHSQMIRPIVAEVKRYGEYSKAGEFVYDHPFQWGSRRIGPDLAREGGKQSMLWHVLHFIDPAQVTPNSIMPKYPWLMTEKVDFSSIPVRIGAMQALGVPYSEAQRRESVEHARAQAAQLHAQLIEQGGDDPRFHELADKKVIALVAYLQRLGMDLFAVPTTQPSPSTGSQIAQTGGD
jgi:cytochrome c oxidase cbb3-type subunit I/II